MKKNPLREFVDGDDRTNAKIAGLLGWSEAKLYRLLAGEQFPAPKDMLKMSTKLSIDPQKWTDFGIAQARKDARG